MLNVAIVIGSTRPGRKAEAVARWVHGIATTRSDAAFALVDISVGQRRRAGPAGIPILVDQHV